jgi:hypothetical protein
MCASQVQQEFAFIPDDGSATYVVDVIVCDITSLQSQDSLLIF